VRSFEERLRDG